MQLNKYCKSQESNIYNSFSIVTIYSAMSSLLPGTDLTRAGKKLRKDMHAGKLGSGV